MINNFSKELLTIRNVYVEILTTVKKVIKLCHMPKAVEEMRRLLQPANRLKSDRQIDRQQ